MLLVLVTMATFSAGAQSKMTEEQAQFHYFKMYDDNDDKMLDGLEFGKAVSHTHGDQGDE